MIKRTSLYSIVLTSIACMLSDAVFAASSVRMLGSTGNTVIGATGDVTKGEAVDSGTKSGSVTTSAVTQTNRSASLRFSPNSTSSVQSYSGLVSSGDNGSTSSNVATSPSARLSIGKYLNLSHSNRPTGGQSSSGGSSTSSKDVDNLRTELDKVKDQVDRLKTGKQNVLVVGDGEYIDITGADNNVISIDVEALKTGLQTALGTDRDILTEIDDDYKIWWCYANSTKTACSGEKQLVVDLGAVLDSYDVTNNNTFRSALAGKQGILSPADNGYITINQRAGTIGVNFNELQSALGISDMKTSEIQYDADHGKLQWRYTDEFENDGHTKKWTTADINALILANLNNYVQISTLQNYVQRSELAGLQGALTADENGYLKIEDNQIDVKFEKLRTDLNIPSEREVEMEIGSDGKINWRYVGSTVWNTTNRSIRDFIDLSGLQGKLIGDDYLDIDGNNIGIKLTELRTALNIPNIQDVELQFDAEGKIQWRYANETAWHTTDQKVSDFVDLSNYVTSGDLINYQEALSVNENGYLTLNDNVLDLKYTELKNRLEVDLNIPTIKDVEMQIAENGKVQWRYKGSETWNETNNSILDFIDLSGLQGKLIGDNYLDINGNNISIKLAELRAALNIPKEQAKIEMEITDAGKLRWRYLDEYETDITTGENVKKWTDVSVDIGDLIDGKLENYVDNTTLQTTLNDYVTNLGLSDELKNYALKSYVDAGLNTKQVKLTEADNGFIEITPVGDVSATIGIKLADLRDALNIPDAKTSEMRVSNGKIQWRYFDEFVQDPETNESVKKWTDVYDLAGLLDDYVKTSTYTPTIARIDGELSDIRTDLAKKQIKLIPAEDGHILLDEETGVIGVDMNSLVEALSEQIDFDARTAELRVDNGNLQWHYKDEGNNTWHTLDLSTVNLPYVTENYLTTNYYSKTDVYNKTEIDAIAEEIENNINLTLQNLAVPSDGPKDSGLYLLSVSDGEGDSKVSTWQTVQIVDGEGVVH